MFAGTGSEIKLRTKKRKHKNTKSSLTTSDVVGRKKQCKDNSDTCTKGTAENNREGLSMNKLNSSELPCSNDLRNRSEGIRTNNKKNKKAKKKKNRKPVEIDGTIVNNIEKVEAYKKSEQEIGENEGTTGVNSSTEKDKKKDENDILQSLFRSSGIHSALKHDRIEQAGNPDYVLVEKEAERVAKEAIKKLRQSRAQCRANGFSVPTWTGSNSTSTAVVQPKKKRFGKSVVNPTLAEQTSNKAIPVKESNHSDRTTFDLESESIDVSSSALLARMRRRNAAVACAGATGGDSESTSKSEESVLLKDIEQYMSSRAERVATSDELTTFFKPRLKTGQNAIFKELLKQICTFEKKDGDGTWRLKEEFT